MAARIGIVDKGFVSAINFLDKRTILPQALDITNEQDSFMYVMELMGRSVVTDNPTYHNFTNRELYATATVTGAPVENVAGTDLDVTLDNAVSGESHPRVGSLVLCPNKTIGYVKTKTDGTGDVINVVSVDGSDMNLSDGDILAFPSNAAGEGSDGPDPIRYALDKHFNQVQIMKESTKLTDIELANKIEVKFEGQNYYTYKATWDALLKFRGDIAFNSFVSRISTTQFSDSSPSLIDGDSNAIQTTKGLNQYIEDSGIDRGSGAIDVAFFAGLAREFAKARCPMNYVVYLGTDPCIAFDNFANAIGASAFSSNARIIVDGKELDIGVDKLSLYGYNYYKKKLPLLDHQNVLNFDNSAGYQNRMFFVPEGKITNHATGGAQDRMRLRYMETDKYGSPYREIRTGALAPTPTDRISVFVITYEYRGGIEVLGPDHFAIYDVQ